WRNVPDLHPTQVPTPDGTAVLLQTASNGVAHFDLVGADHKIIKTIGTATDAHHGEIGFSAAYGQYVAFVYQLSDGADGQNAQNVWLLYLFDRAGGKLTVVAKNPVGASDQPL